MIEMNPYYAHPSAVGPVFDVAHFSRWKSLHMGLAAAVFGVLATALLVVAWKPDLVFDKPPKIVEDLHKETLELREKKPWYALGGTAIVGLVAFVGIAGACCSLGNAIGGNYYFRAGPGGLSLRVPGTLDWKALGLRYRVIEMDVPAEWIESWEIVQGKRIGSLSGSAGNLYGLFSMKLDDGRHIGFGLDCFREPARIIYDRIKESQQMVPARLDEEPATA